MADRETIIETGGDSGSAAIIGIIVVLAIAGIAWLFFSGSLNMPAAPAGPTTNVDVTLPAPAVPAPADPAPAPAAN